MIRFDMIRYDSIRFGSTRMQLVIVTDASIDTDTDADTRTTTTADACSTSKSQRPCVVLAAELASRRSRKVSLSLKAIMTLMVQVLEAVEHLAARELFCASVAPADLMLVADTRLKLSTCLPMLNSTIVCD